VCVLAKRNAPLPHNFLKVDRAQQAGATDRIWVRNAAHMNVHEAIFTGNCFDRGVATLQNRIQVLLRVIKNNASGQSNDIH
jgi:hypothetical protein